MKSLFYFFPLFIVSNIIYGNGNLTSKNQDSLFAVQYFDLAWDYRNSYPDSSFVYAKKSLNLADRWGLYELKAYALGRIGIYYREYRVI